MTIIGFQTWIGNVQVKTKSVHFYVQRSYKYPSDSGYLNGPITFEVEQLNVGGAMDLTTGEFTAPVNGIYHFEFVCLKDKVPFESNIYLLVRQKSSTVSTSFVIGLGYGKVPIVAGIIMSNLSYHSTGSLTASLKLKAGDVVILYSNNRREILYDNVKHFTQFVGWLVDEDLAVA